MDGRVWRVVCGAVDRARAHQVPVAGLAPEMPSPVRREECLDPRAIEDPGRFYPAPATVRPEVWETLRQTEGVEIEALEFASPAPLGLPVNDVVRVRFYRPAGRRPQAAVVVLHGLWRRGRGFEDRLCRDLARAGVGVALPALPFHWERAIPGSPSGAFFLSSDPLWTSAAFRQAVVDARAVLALLRGRAMPVGVFGMSLGGILAHVLLAVEPVDFAVTALAGGDTAGIVWESPLTRRYREAMEARGITYAELGALWRPGNPLVYAARGRPPRLRMLAARYDQLIPARFTLALWRALGRPPLEWLPAGHVTACLFRGAFLRAVLDTAGLPAATARPGRVPLAPAAAGAARGAA